MPGKKSASSTSARLVLLCVPFAAPCYILLDLGAHDWKENVLQVRANMPPPRPTQELWLASWSKIAQMKARCYRNWLSSPQLAAETLDNFSVDTVMAFAATVSVGGGTDFVTSWHRMILSSIEHACSHALGGDIVLELVGSTVRDTGSLVGFIGKDGDLDIQVSRRPGSGRVHEPFTETDKRRVAQNLEKLDFISNVTIGRIAIKFGISSFLNVDLVLWRERPEEFPALRGGSSFYDNSKRINSFLDQTPAARHAIFAIKSYFSRGRPKGLLLETIAWRLGSMNLELKTILRRVADGSIPENLGSFMFFSAMFEELRDWKRAPHFGRELQQDLAMLSDKKRGEYTAGFEAIACITDAGFGFNLLLCASDVRAVAATAVTPGNMWCHKVPAAAEEALRYYFSAFLEQEPSDRAPKR